MSTPTIQLMVLSSSGDEGHSLVHCFLSSRNATAEVVCCGDDVNIYNRNRVYTIDQKSVNLIIYDVQRSALDKPLVKLLMASVDAFLIAYNADEEDALERLDDVRDRILLERGDRNQHTMSVVGVKQGCHDRIWFSTSDVAAIVCGEWKATYVEISTSNMVPVVGIINAIIRVALNSRKLSRRI